jgi:uncharacterized membrane protein YqaE (UPF0057 family)
MRALGSATSACVRVVLSFFLHYCVVFLEGGFISSRPIGGIWIVQIGDVTQSAGGGFYRSNWMRRLRSEF